MPRLITSLTILGIAGAVVYSGLFAIEYFVQAPQRPDASLNASATDQPAQLAGEVEVWSWGIAAKSLNALLPDFSERYPNVQVDVNMTGAKMQTRFFLSLSAGVGAPDVSQLQIREALRYAATGQLADLTAVAEKYRDAFPPSFWENCVYNGRVYAIPWDMGPCAVYYKRALFEKYDIDPTTIITWDDFIKIGKQLLEKSGGRTRMMPLYTGDLQNIFEILMQQNGGQMFDENGKIAIYSDASLQVLQTIKRLLESGITYNVKTDGHEYMAGFKNDTIATYPMAVWFGGALKDTVQEYPGQAADWGVFRLPALTPGGLRTSNRGGSVLVIPRQCEQKAAAWAFIEYALCTVEGQITQYRNYDLFPAYLPALEDPFFEAPDPFYGNQPVRALFSKDLTKIPTLQRTSDWMQAERYLGQSLSKWSTLGRKNEGFFEDLEQKLARRIGREISPESLSR